MSSVTDRVIWQCRLTVAKFRGEWESGKPPYDIQQYDGNLLVYGGASAMWQALIAGSGWGSGSLLQFNNTNAAIGVGDGAAAAVNTQTDLQGTNKFRKGMNAGYPEHVDGVVVGAATVRFRATFDTTQANFSWQEAGLFNTATLAAGRMLNRRVQDMGTKTSSSSWQATFDLTLA